MTQDFYNIYDTDTLTCHDTMNPMLFYDSFH